MATEQKQRINRKDQLGVETLRHKLKNLRTLRPESEPRNLTQAQRRSLSSHYDGFRVWDFDLGPLVRPWVA